MMAAILKELVLLLGIGRLEPFEEGTTEDEFLAEYRAAALKGAFYASTAASAIYLAFLGIALASEKYISGAIVTRVILVIGLLLAALVFRFLPDFARRYYVLVAGGASAFVLSGTEYLLSLGPYGMPDVAAGASPSMMLALFLHYSFLRLPRWAAAGIGWGVSIANAAWGAPMVVGGNVAARTFLYLFSANVAGTLICGMIESRERELFRQRRRAEAAQAELDRRAAVAEEANREKTRLIAAVSHDLRQPMAAAQAYMTVLQGRLQKRDFEKAEKQATNLSNSIHMLSTTLDHLLTAARYDSGTEPIRIEQVELGQILARIEETFAPDAAQRGIDLRVRRPRRRIVLSTDAAALWRVLVNLVSNAVKFTASAERQHGGVLVRAGMRGGVCRIDVVDTGIGIANTHLDAIWEPYFQVANSERNRERGLGLGLFLVRRAVDHLPGHRLSVQSRVGRGTRFSLSVPGIALSEPDFLFTHRRELRASDLEVLQGAHAVIIEDDADARNALEELLAEWSVVYTSGSRLEEVIPQLDESLRTVDCIVSDYRLPGPYTGTQCIAMLRQKLEMAIPAIIVTGESEQSRIRAELPGDTVLLQKPFDADALARPLIDAVRLAREREAAM